MKRFRWASLPFAVYALIFTIAPLILIIFYSFTDWSARIRDISFELTDVDTGATWQTTTPALHVGRWNDIWEVRVNPFHLSKALAHVILVVDTDRLNDEGGRVLIALGILEAVEACGRASEMVERLNGAYIHDDDWDEEQFILEP